MMSSCGAVLALTFLAVPASALTMTQPVPKPRNPWVATPQCPMPDGAESWSQKSEDVHLYNNYFCGRRNGTYVEMGALDGVHLSNTKFFEDHMGWKGALIEASPPSAQELRKNRNSRNSIFGEAVCAKGVGHLDFLVGDTPATNSVSGSMPDSWVDHFSHDNKPKKVSVPCRPVGEMLKEMLKHTGANSIDFFSLDVEGNELMVLETMDWSVKVGLWFIEHSGGRTWSKEDLTKEMESHGYKLLPVEPWMTNNHVYVPVQ